MIARPFLLRWVRDCRPKAVSWKDRPEIQNYVVDQPTGFAADFRPNQAAFIALANQRCPHGSSWKTVTASDPRQTRLLRLK